MSRKYGPDFTYYDVMSDNPMSGIHENTSQRNIDYYGRQANIQRIQQQEKQEEFQSKNGLNLSFSDFSVHTPYFQNTSIFENSTPGTSIYNYNQQNGLRSTIQIPTITRQVQVNTVDGKPGFPEMFVFHNETKIKVIPQGSKQSVEATRGLPPKIGFFDNHGQRIMVKNGDIIQVLQDNNPQMAYNQMQSIEGNNGYFNEGFNGNIIDRSHQIRASESGERVWNNPMFQEEMQAMCSRLGINPHDLKLVMIKESGINTRAQNKKTSATGLIQFMPETAIGLGTNIHALRKMSPVQQLDYVEKFYRPYARSGLNSVDRLYLATFYPAALDYRDPNFKLGSEKGSLANARKIARQNPGIAKFSGGQYITLAGFRRYVEDSLQKHLQV